MAASVSIPGSIPSWPLKIFLSFGNRRKNTRLPMYAGRVTVRADPSQLSAIFSVTNEKNIAKATKYHATYVAPRLLVRPLSMFTKRMRFA
jgi:hypothetical protein